MSYIDMVGGSDYIAVSRKLCQKMGPNSAVLYSELIDRYKFYNKFGKLDDEGMFYATIDDVKDKIGLTADQQRSCFKKLQKLALVSTKRKGIPAKRYIKIYENPDFLREILNLNPNETRDTQKPENPVTNDGISKQLITGKSVNKLRENQVQTNLNNNHNKQSNNNVVVEKLMQYGIDIKPVLEKNPNIFSAYSISEIETIAKVLAEKKKQGKIKNPVGLILQSPQSVFKQILENSFYPDVTKKEYSDEYEIFSLPVLNEI